MHACAHKHICTYVTWQARLLRQIDKGKLPEENYPYKMCSSQRNLVDAMRALKRGPNEVIVFFVGGKFDSCVLKRVLVYV
jgi:hypothetical protein